MDHLKNVVFFYGKYLNILEIIIENNKIKILKNN